MVSIVIPAYNEQNRIARTLEAYGQYTKQHSLSWEIIVVLNGCTDNTEKIVNQYITRHANISYIITSNKGKGIAIREGFLWALKNNHSLCIGFVDADCAIVPEEFDLLCKQILDCKNKDVVIGSRYMPESKVVRPIYKNLGRKIIYQPLLYLLFGFNFYDIQCGAKVFKRSVISSIIPYLTTVGWSIDPEILYVSKKQNYAIAEIPIKWQDQKESKFTIFAGIKMLTDLFRLRYQHR